MYRRFGGRRVRRIARGCASCAQLDFKVLNIGELVTVVVCVVWDGVEVLTWGHFVLRHHWLPLLVVVYSPYYVLLLKYLHLIGLWLTAKHFMISDQDLPLAKATW